jgi:PBP4 family serine-type D-alanyl-D-alanine carboxypeptidase
MIISFGGILKFIQKLITFFLIVLISNILFCFGETVCYDVDSVKHSEFLANLSEKSNKNSSSYVTFDFQKSKESLIIKFDSILKKYNLTSTKYSLSVYSLNAKSYFFEKNPDIFLKPASVTKLLTAYSIFEMLTDTFNFRTCLFTEDTDLNDGVVNGNIFIRGVGDPKISLSDLDNLVQKLLSLGIRKIDGKIIADGTFYDNKRNRFAYSGDADEVEPVAPISALSLEKNRIKILINTHVQGDVPKIQVIPNSEHFILNNNVKITVSSKKGKMKSQNRFSAHSKLNESGNQVIYLNGSISKDASYGVEDFNLNPDLTFASVLRHRLISNCIKVVGNSELLKKQIKINYSNLNAIANIDRPLTEVISEMNKNSDNYLAENLFKLTGAHFNHDTLTSASAKKFIDTLISNLSHSSNEIEKTRAKFQVNDGSGLSRRNMFSSRLVCELLKNTTSKVYFNSFIKSLAICGFDGTLSKRLKNTNAQMNLTAKTGTHRDVSGLAGFVSDLDGEIYIFAFLFNGPSVGTYKMIENELSLVLANFSTNEAKNLNVNP